MAQGNGKKAHASIDDNPAVESTRVHVAGSDVEEGQELNADNVVELTTENEVAKRNLEHGREGRDDKDERDQPARQEPAQDKKADKKAGSNDRKSK